MRYVAHGFIVIFFLAIPWLGYRFGEDSRNEIEADEFERRGSRGA
jgi:hypothetical protein